MKILSIETAFPSRVVSNEMVLTEFDARIGRNVSAADLRDLHGRLERSLEFVGARERRHRDDGECALDFGVAAGRAALQAANLTGADLDLLIYVGVGRGFIEPATANVFLTELECPQATGFDVLDACASWLRGVEIAQHYLRSGTARRAMILNCEFNFREYANWELRTPGELATAWSVFTIGEAATATILAADDAYDDMRIRFRNAGADFHRCHIPLPNFDQYHRPAPDATHETLRFYSDASPLTRRALALLHEVYSTDPVFTRDGYDLICTHSASTRVSVTGLQSFGLPADRGDDGFPRYGNTVSASLPVALADAAANGRLQRGDRVLLLMGSAGIAAGVGEFRY